MGRLDGLLQAAEGSGQNSASSSRRLERLVPQRVEAAGSLAALGEEAGLLEHADVLADRLLGEGEGRRDLARRPFGVLDRRRICRLCGSASACSAASGAAGVDGFRLHSSVRHVVLVPGESVGRHARCRAGSGILCNGLSCLSGEHDARRNGSFAVAAGNDEHRLCDGLVEWRRSGIVPAYSRVAGLFIADSRSAWPRRHA